MTTSRGSVIPVDPSQEDVTILSDNNFEVYIFFKIIRLFSKKKIKIKTKHTTIWIVFFSKQKNKRGNYWADQLQK